MKNFIVIVFSFFVLLFGSYSCYANFFPSKLSRTVHTFISKHNASKIEIQHNLSIVLEESNLEIEEDFSCNDDVKKSLTKNSNVFNYNFSEINGTLVALFDLNIFNNYFKNHPQIIIGHNPLYLTQSVFLI